MIGMELKPCGGCGEADPSKRCIGCLHDFGGDSSAWVHKYTRTPAPAQIRADALREAVGKYVIDPAQPAVGSIWRHLKSGHIYRVIACGLIESNIMPSVIYTNINPDSDPVSAANWVRPMVDFCDGRFALLATPLSPTAVDNSPAPDAGDTGGV